MATFEDIKKANQCIETTDIKGKDYAQVNQRVKAFRMVYPQGCINTEILQHDDELVLMRTTILDEDGNIISTGMAFEKQNSSYINKTSYIENCESSAVGRALGFAGFGIETSICSAEELTNALHNQAGGSAPKLKPLPHTAKELKEIAEQNYIDLTPWLEKAGVKTAEELTQEQIDKTVAWIESRKRGKK